MENANKIYYWIAFSVLCSIVAVCFSLFRVAPFTVSESGYIGIIVSLMGIIFTVFIGYQIYNILDIKKEMKDFASQKEVLEQAISELSEAQAVTEAYNFSNRGMLAISMANYDSALCLLLKALDVLLFSPLLGNHWVDVENLRTNIKFCHSKANYSKIKNDEEFYKTLSHLMASPKYSDELKQLLVDLKKNYDKSS